VVGRLVADPAGDRTPVRRHLGVPGHTVDPTGLSNQVRRPDHHLARDTTPVRALAADEAALDAGDREPGLGQSARHLLAPYAHPDDDDIHPLSHGRSLAPGCRRSMAGLPPTAKKASTVDRPASLPVASADSCPQAYRSMCVPAGGGGKVISRGPH